MIKNEKPLCYMVTFYDKDGCCFDESRYDNLQEAYEYHNYGVNADGEYVVIYAVIKCSRYKVWVQLLSTK